LICLARRSLHADSKPILDSAQFVASFSPNAMAASVLYSSFFSFVIIFNGVVQPVAQLPYFWRSWM
jgi:ATP-binding cassette subfamily G (WHITE) protein 2 (SNQ2)